MSKFATTDHGIQYVSDQHSAAMALLRDHGDRLTGRLALVRDLETGETWLVRAGRPGDDDGTLTLENAPDKPKSRYRRRYRDDSVMTVRGMLPCVACGELTTLKNDDERGPDGHADRIAQDHPRFVAVGMGHRTKTRLYGPLPYCRATVANVCAACNGGTGESRDAGTDGMKQLAKIARQRLMEYGTLL